MNHPRSDWTPERYQEAIAQLRLSAYNKRKLADKNDAEADSLRKELAGKQTLELFKELNE